MEQHIFKVAIIAEGTTDVVSQFRVFTAKIYDLMYTSVYFKHNRMIKTTELSL